MVLHNLKKWGGLLSGVEIGPNKTEIVSEPAADVAVPTDVVIGMTGRGIW